MLNIQDEVEALARIAQFDCVTEPEVWREHVFYTGDVDCDDNGYYVYEGSTVYEDFYAARERYPRVFAFVYSSADENKLQIDGYDGYAEVARIRTDDEIWPVIRVNGPIG